MKIKCITVNWFNMAALIFGVRKLTWATASSALAES
jgi:hypothetical protein